MANVNRLGRNRSPRFVMLYHAMMDSDAYRDLSGNAVKLLLHLIKMSNGSNNGELFLSERDAATAIGVARNTASKALQELIGHGFLRVVDAGHFHVKLKRATTWRLTHLPIAGRSAPTNDWRDWRPSADSRAQKLNGTGAKIEPVTHEQSVSGAEFEPVSDGDPQISVNAIGSIIAPHIDMPCTGSADQGS